MEIDTAKDHGKPLIDSSETFNTIRDAGHNRSTRLTEDWTILNDRVNKCLTHDRLGVALPKDVLSITSESIPSGGLLFQPADEAQYNVIRLRDELYAELMVAGLELITIDNKKAMTFVLLNRSLYGNKWVEEI